MGATGGRRPTMSDVGRRAGVSAQTVSRYFTGGYVSEPVRQRVEAAVAELGYVRNRLPLQLRARRTNTIGVVLFGPLNYGAASIMTGLYRAARALGQAVMTTQMDSDPVVGPGAMTQILAEIDAFVSMRVDALVMASPYASLGAIVEHVADAVPVVTVAEDAHEATEAVGAYSYKGARTVTDHLIASGHRRILHLAGPLSRAQARERRRGYEDALSRAGLQGLPVMECREWDARSGALCGQQVDPESFTAVFAANDEIALGFLHAMARRGLRSPRDFAVAGFDDVPDAVFMTPPLTTMRVDFESFGEKALTVAAELAAGGRRRRRSPVVAELVVRESTSR